MIGKKEKILEIDDFIPIKISSYNIWHFFFDDFCDGKYNLVYPFQVGFGEMYFGNNDFSTINKPICHFE